MSFDHCSVEELFGPQAKGSETIRFDRLTQEPMVTCPQGHSVALGRLPWQSACNKCPQHKGWQASDILRYYNSVLSMSPLPWHGSVKGRRSECAVAEFKGHALRFKKSSGKNWVVLSPAEAAAQKGKGGAPQAPPAGKGPQTVPPRGWLTQSEPEQTQPEAAQENLLGPAQPSMVQLPSASEMPRDDGVRRVLSVDHSVLPQRVTDVVQTTEELMGKDPSASLTKMALMDTNVLSDDVAQELAAKTAQLDSLDQAVLSLQGDIQLLRKSSAELATQKEKLSTLLAELEKPSQAEAATEVAQEAEASAQGCFQAPHG